ncbi:hypothetical protein COO60DRAFT_1539502 [Scenedesmus sp. NREL 46B-D3]|nr:hypothetical protein COO60DRAFT_1539502 [Scenedesmus sp. NREL 46B-D3]
MRCSLVVLTPVPLWCLSVYGDAGDDTRFEWRVAVAHAPTVLAANKQLQLQPAVRMQQLPSVLHLVRLTVLFCLVKQERFSVPAE